MKMKLITLTLIAALFLIFGCSKEAEVSRQYDSPSPSLARSATLAGFKDMSNLYGEMAMPEGLAGVEGQVSPRFRDMEYTSSESEEANFPSDERKLVKRANVRIRVENLSAASASISALLEEYSGYSASTNIEKNSHYYSLRIPSQYYDVFLAGIDGMGRLLQRHEATEDVTLRYYDLEGRLATKKELLGTFQSYLRRANNIEEILSVERRISELQYDIEGTGIQFRNLANKIDYATIDLSLLGPAATVQKQGMTLGEEIKRLFSGFGGFLSGVLVTILYIVIYGIPLAALLVLCFWLFFGKIGLLRKLWSLVKAKKQS
ncbi:MAG: DUF4349 domain-containing protein [Treponema sp.]|nr:DUF4349 domain-containing protein [Treponema sp.]